MAKTKATRKTAARKAKQARPVARKTAKNPKPAPATKTAAKRRAGTKQALLIERLRKGATIAELTEATGWQAHSVRGAISGALKKKLGLAITSKTVEGKGRVYRTI